LHPNRSAAARALRLFDRIHRQSRCKPHAVNSFPLFFVLRSRFSPHWTKVQYTTTPPFHREWNRTTAAGRCKSRRRTFPTKGKGVANESDDQSGIGAIGIVNRSIRSHRMLRGSGAVLRVRLRLLPLLLLPGLPELLSVLLPAVSVRWRPASTRRRFGTCL
jgi:hypothetical protein